ncbi:MAG: OmpA family protein [Candidatus Omnitrophica bacterium]|nr:OmpA family protein [Candidatus Omnitrophota bacterium]
MFCRKINIFIMVFSVFLIFCNHSIAEKLSKEDQKMQQIKQMQKHFEWWPTDARPAPVKDENKSGYWWWPMEPGEIRPWGNRGYIYVYKIIFDYKEEELDPPAAQELRPSLLIKKVLSNVKVYFDFDKSDLRDDAKAILKKASDTMRRNPYASILVTGNCDIRGSETYNEKLGRQRGEAVKKFMLEGGIHPDRVLIVSRGKLDAVAPVTDLVGMQKDRNAQFMIAEVEEVMIPYPDIEAGQEVKRIGEDKFLLQEEKKIEAEIKVATKEYIVQAGDSLSKIAKEHLGAAHRWQYLYELNKDKIANPNKLKKGQKIILPIE